MSDDCRRARDLIVRRVTGAAGAGESADLLGHAAACPACDRELTLSLRAWDLAAAGSPPLPDSQKTLDAVRRRAAPTPITHSGRIAMAAALLAAIGILLLVGVPRVDPAHPTLPAASPPQEDPEADLLRRLAQKVRSNVAASHREARAALLKIGPRAIPFLAAELTLRPGKDGRAAVEQVIADIEADARAASLPKTWPSGTYELLRNEDGRRQGFWSTSVQKDADGQLVMVDTVVLDEAGEVSVRSVTIRVSPDRLLVPTRIESNDGTDLRLHKGFLQGTWAKVPVKRPMSDDLAVPGLLWRAAAILPRVPDAAREFTLIRPGQGGLDPQRYRAWSKGPADEEDVGGAWAFAINPLGKDENHDQVEFDPATGTLEMRSFDGLAIHPRRLSPEAAHDADLLAWQDVDFTVTLPTGKRPVLEGIETSSESGFLFATPAFHTRKDGVRRMWINGDRLILDGDGVHLNGRKLFDAGTRVRVTGRNGKPTGVSRE